MQYRMCMFTEVHEPHPWNLIADTPLWCTGICERKEKLKIESYPDPVLEESLKADFTKGGSMDPTQFRNLVKQVRGRDISTEEATHFLKLFGEDLEAHVLKAKRAFVEHHFGAKIPTSTGPK